MQRQALQDNIAQIAHRFVAARRDATALMEYPGTMPAALAEAYAMQDAAIALTDRPIAGWKVGRINPPIEGCDRLAGPIFADQTFEGGATPRAMTVYAGGFAAAEAEFLLRIAATPDAAKRDYTLAEATALIDRVCVGIEIASSPFGGINDHGAPVTISDFGNNNGLVIGPEIVGWQCNRSQRLAGRIDDRRSLDRGCHRCRHAGRAVRCGALPVRTDGHARNRIDRRTMDFDRCSQRRASSGDRRADRGNIRQSADGGVHHRGAIVRR